MVYRPSIRYSCQATVVQPVASCRSSAAVLVIAFGLGLPIHAAPESGGEKPVQDPDAALERSASGKKDASASPDGPADGVQRRQPNPGREATPPVVQPRPPPEFRGPDITLIAGEERTVYEYRQNGQLRMIKVVPKFGKPYYLAPRDPTRGWGDLEQADSLIAQWVLWEF